MDDEALDLCEEWHMKPDESLLDSKSSPEEDKDEEDKEEEDKDEEDKDEEDKDEEDKEAVRESITTIVESYTASSKSFIGDLLKWSTESDAKNEAKLSAKQEELDNLKADFDDLQAKYDVIKKKFDTMKSIFA